MTHKTKHFEFNHLNKEELQLFISKREGETKLGQQLTDLPQAKYVIIGVEESVGPRANKGRGGAEKGFKAFLSSFLNMQSNESLIGNHIHVLGSVSTHTEAGFDGNLNQMVEELDNFLVKILHEHINQNQIPIVIGGGHNNAYPLMKFSYERYQQQIQVVNFDAHADYRRLEGRHSGNPFSYAFKDGYLKKYFVLGLHQRFNSQQIIDDLRRDGHYFTFYESYIFGEHNYLDDFQTLRDNLTRTKDCTGVELDMDTIERMPSSAFSPSGISVDIARLYINQVAKKKNIAYLHLPEGAPTNELEERIVGKTLAYLVSDFIVSHG